MGTGRIVHVADRA